MLKIVTVIAMLFLLLTAMVFFMQRSMLYHPSRIGLTTEHASALNLTKWPDDAAYHGYLYEPPNSELTIIVFHGNAGEAAHRHYYLTAFSHTHARILLAEYPGYGERAGKLSEKTLVDDAKTTIDLVSKAYPDEPVLVVGESMGAGVASAAVSTALTQTENDHATVQGLILITPWDSLPNLAQHYFWYLPARWLVLDRYDSASNLQSFNAPIAVVVAEQDRIIPPKHANNLYNTITTKKKLFMLETAGHNNWIDFVDANWWDALLAFMLSNSDQVQD